MTWMCPCGNVMKLSILSCTVCGGKKAAGKSMLVMKGDWFCNSCKKNNFVKRKPCFSCGVDKVAYLCAIVSIVILVCMKLE